jgi:outer membrane murein-binding lipoprotein Lpp
MAKTSAHFKPVKPGSEEHNRRLKKLDYVREELTKNNMSWSAQSVADRLKQIKQLVKEKTGRSLQSKATPIREAVVVLKQETTMEDLHRLRAAYKERFGIDIFQMDIHKDEGHFNKKGKWIGNYHGHLTGDFIDHRTGKSLKLTRQQMSELQTVTAEVLGMERGVSSDRKHLSALQFKIESLQKQIEQLRNEIGSMDAIKATKERLLGFLGMSSKDKEIKRQSDENGALRATIEQLKEEKKQLKAALKASQDETNQLKAGIDNLLRSKDAELADVTNSRDIWARKARNLEQQLEELQDNQEEQEQSRGIHGHR